MFKNEPASFAKVLKISLFSGLITSTVVNPFWVLHSKLSVKKKHKDFLKEFSKIINNGGIKELFKGLIASLLLVLNPIIQFTIYEVLKRNLSKYLLMRINCL